MQAWLRKNGENSRYHKNPNGTTCPYCMHDSENGRDNKSKNSRKETGYPNPYVPTKRNRDR